MEAKAPAQPPADAKSGTQTGVTTSSADRGAGDQRRVIVNPHRAASDHPLPPIPSASSISSDSSESLEEYDTAEHHKGMGFANLGKHPAKSVSATLVSATGLSKRQRDSKFREPGASPSLGCLPADTAETLATPGTRPPFSSSDSDSDTSFSAMGADLVEIDLYHETDGVIMNALERNSDTVSPRSPAGAAWLEAAIAAVTDTEPETTGPPPPTSPTRSDDYQHQSLLDPTTGELSVELPLPMDAIRDVEFLNPLGIVAPDAAEDARDLAIPANSQRLSTIDENLVDIDLPGPGSPAPTAPLDTGAPAVDDKGASLPPGRIVRPPELRLTDVLEAATNIRSSQAAAVTQLLMRRHTGPHPQEVLVDFLHLSIATRQRILSRLLDQITQFELTGASDADILASVINLLQRLYSEGARP